MGSPATVALVSIVVEMIEVKGVYERASVTFRGVFLGTRRGGYVKGHVLPWVSPTPVVLWWPPVRLPDA